jgi:hypothetical protein
VNHDLGTNPKPGSIMTFWRELTKRELLLAGAVALGVAALRRLPDWEKQRTSDEQVARRLDRVPEAFSDFREALEQATFRLSVLVALSDRVNHTIGQLQRVLEAAENPKLFTSSELPAIGEAWRASRVRHAAG